MSWALPRFDYLVSFGGASHVGNVRKNNEDAWGLDPSLGIFAVADGMGGHAAGEVAARLAVDYSVARLRAKDAVEVFDRYLEAHTIEARSKVFEVLAQGAEHAHSIITSEAKKNPAQRGMGCTLDLMILLGTHAFIIHVGDSRVYLARPTTTIQLTNDHTLHGTLMARGVGTPSVPPAGLETLTNAVGRPGKLRADEVFAELSPDDRIILCTDGIYGELETEAAVAEIAQKGSPEEAAVALINGALDRAGRDNATAVVVEVGKQRVQRSASDGGLAARDFSYAAHCPILAGLSDQLIGRALQSAIEVKFEEGAVLPRINASDRVAYILLEGTVATPQGWTLGPSALLYPESLGGGGRGPELCKAIQPVRAFRIRTDDFREVCNADTALAAALYERLTRNLARMLG